MWIGCVHPDRLLSYPDVCYLSGCLLPIRMLIARPRGFAGTWFARSASAPGSLVRVCARIVWTAGLSDWLQASVLLRARRARVLNGPPQTSSSAQRSALGGLECSTVRVRRARACADNPRHHVWFPNNVARNSLVNISDFENASLELQCLWGVSKTDRHKLRATFGGGEGEGAGKRSVRASPATGVSPRQAPRATVADHVRQQKRPQPSPTTCAATRAPTPPGQEKPATASSRRRTPTRPPPPTRNE